jgi:hypothetical protein
MEEPAGEVYGKLFTGREGGSFWSERNEDLQPAIAANC